MNAFRWVDADSEPRTPMLKLFTIGPRRRANLAHVTQSRLDSGLGSQLKVCVTF